MSALVEIDDLAFVAFAPDVAEPASSLDQAGSLAYYTPEEFMDAVLRIRDVDLVSPEDASLNGWAARWSVGNRFIEVREVSVVDGPEKTWSDDPEYPSRLWGGSRLRAKCFPTDLACFLQGIRESLPGVWLHGSDCRLWSPKTVEQYIEQLIN